jgi:predicted dehydrogenase
MYSQQGQGTTRVRLGVVGTGFGQTAHIPAFLSTQGCQVVAVCASSESRAREAAGRFGIAKAYGDWQALVNDPEINAVSIATIPRLQPAIALAAIARGKAVFCEKPLAAALPEAEELAESAQRAGVANMCDFELPELLSWRTARSLLEEGRIGPLRYVAIDWHIETYANRMGLASWKTDRDAGGGALNLFVSHTFHYIEWFLGPISELTARLCRAPNDARAGDTTDMLSLKLRSGVPVSVSVSTNAFLGAGHRLVFYGDEGVLVLHNPTADYARGFRLFIGERQSNRLEEFALPDEFEGVEDGRTLLVGRLAARFVNWVHSGAPAHPDFAEALRVQRLLEAARRSDASGCLIREPF